MVIAETIVFFITVESGEPQEATALAYPFLCHHSAAHRSSLKLSDIPAALLHFSHGVVSHYRSVAASAIKPIVWQVLHDIPSA